MEMKIKWEDPENGGAEEAIISGDRRFSLRIGSGTDIIFQGGSIELPQNCNLVITRWNGANPDKPLVVTEIYGSLLKLYPGHTLTAKLTGLGTLTVDYCMKPEERLSPAALQISRFFDIVFTLVNGLALKESKGGLHPLSNVIARAGQCGFVTLAEELISKAPESGKCSLNGHDLWLEWELRENPGKWPLILTTTTTNSSGIYTNALEHFKSIIANNKWN